MSAKTTRFKSVLRGISHVCDYLLTNGRTLLITIIKIIIMAVTSPYQCLTLSLLILPPLLLTTYFMAAFPLPPGTVYIHPSLECLPSTSKSWTIYPDNFYPGGGYATFPNGKVGLISVLTKKYNDRNSLDSILAFGTREW